MQRYLGSFLSFFLLFLSACTNKSVETKVSAVTPIVGQENQEAILRTSHGNIIFQFFPESAPHTVTRIKELIATGFYDGLIFHRVVPGFVVQTGDPTQSGSGGSGKKLKAEFNSLKHKLGTVAMARAQDVDSADSQFYIALADLPQLDGQYTIFAQVIEGLDILPKIVEGDKILSISLRAAK